MSYEYLYPRTNKLAEKPFKADHIMKLAEKAGIRPIAIRVDNITGQIFFYFDSELDREDKELLDKFVDGLFSEW